MLPSRRYFFVAFFPYSKYTYIQSYKEKTQDIWAKAIMDMLECMNGVPTHIDTENEPYAFYNYRPTRQFRDVSEYYGFTIRLKRNKSFYPRIAEIEDKLLSKCVITEIIFENELSDYITDLMNECKDVMKSSAESFHYETLFMNPLPERELFV